jgi:sugar/nucleoside kinase (ribokinase family)
VAGLATIDILTRPAALSEPIGSGVLRLVDRIDLSTGGCVSNVGTGLSRLGIATAAITDVGDDVWGHLWRERMTAGGVDCAGARLHPGAATSVTNVLVDRNSDRSFLFSPGVSTNLDLDAFRESLRNFPRAKWLLFGYYSLFPACDAKLPELFEATRARGLKTALDTAGDGGSMDPLARILPNLDLYFPSYNEASHQTQLADPAEMIDRYRQHGATGIVGIKMGSQGAIVSPEAGACFRIAAHSPPSPAIDTTGAGDAFIAGLLAALVSGFEIESAGQIAAATAACSITALGATAGIRSWEETRALAGL